MPAPAWLRRAEVQNGIRPKEPSAFEGDGARVVREDSWGATIPDHLFREGPWAVLCPGPWLQQWLDLPAEEKRKYVGVIGVNRAGCHYPCSAVALLDFKTYGEVVEAGGYQGTPHLFCPGPEGRGLSAKYGPKGAWVGDNRVSSLQKIAKDRKMCPQPYTVNAAVQIAWVLGASRVDCFGMTWSGVLDVDGFRAKGDRSGMRWQKEYNTFGQVVDFLAEKGVEVRRVVPEK